MTEQNGHGDVGGDGEAGEVDSDVVETAWRAVQAFDPATAAYRGEIAAAVQHHGAAAIGRGLILLTAALVQVMSIDLTNNGENDPLGLLLSPILRRLRQAEIAEDTVPTAAGVIAAGTAGQDAVQWRDSLGTTSASEVQTLAWLTWLVRDLMTPETADAAIAEQLLG